MQRKGIVLLGLKKEILLSEGPNLLEKLVIREFDAEVQIFK